MSLKRWQKRSKQNSGHEKSSSGKNADGSGKRYHIGEAYDNEQNGGTVTLYAKWEKTDILIYKNGNCKARVFVEDDDFLGFGNDGSVHGTEFIEGTSVNFGSNGFSFVEMIER